MDLGIAGKKAIVCASSRGLGKGCALALVREGVDLVVNGRDRAVLNATARAALLHFAIPKGVDRQNPRSVGSRLPSRHLHLRSRLGARAPVHDAVRPDGTTCGRLVNATEPQIADTVPTRSTSRRTARIARSSLKQRRGHMTTPSMTLLAWFP
jgi:hypothetical protein